MYSHCAPYLRHRFRKENRNTGGLCCAIIPVLGSGENESHSLPTNSRQEPNDNLSLEKYRVIYSVNVPIQLNCSSNYLLLSECRILLFHVSMYFF